jgi:predicted nuclease of restriction endonuclease-like (RecB) superfamily
MTARKLTKPKPGSEVQAREYSGIYERIREILESARTGVARTVNTTQVVANWLIGRELVEGEQRGESRAEYGRRLLAELSGRLTAEFGKGYSITNLEHFRDFYITYGDLIPDEIPHAMRGELKAQSSDATSRAPAQKSHAVRGEFATDHTAGDQSWIPGRRHSNLSWTHYRVLLRVEKGDARAFYEIEAIKNNWSARELERQISSLLFERLAKSRDKAGLMKLATKGQEISAPADVFKDPVVIEFLGLPECHRLVESDLEQALINNLQAFLLELGKGFAFLSRQERITLEGDHFYIDLVFYHAVLKCYILIDLKVGKLNHGDLGQMQLYANFFDLERRTEGDNPTLGLILCTDKNDAVVKYLLGPDQSKKIFTSRYKLHLPTETELATELKREVRALT